QPQEPPRSGLAIMKSAVTARSSAIGTKPFTTTLAKSPRSAATDMVGSMSRPGGRWKSIPDGAKPTRQAKRPEVKAIPDENSQMISTIAFDKWPHGTGSPRWAAFLVFILLCQCPVEAASTQAGSPGAESGFEVLP